jgi:hypothetical protein
MDEETIVEEKNTEGTYKIFEYFEKHHSLLIAVFFCLCCHWFMCHERFNIYTGA